MIFRKKHSTMVFPGRRMPVPDVTGERYFTDFYHHLLISSWPSLLLQITSAFIALNTIFAFAYLMDGGIDNARPGSFLDVFFFSVETMATIGYGRMSPLTVPANILMSIEALIGLMGLAVMTGLIFAKFSRPSARVRFSRMAVVSMRDGVPCLMFRMANVRSTQIVEAQIHVVFTRQEKTLEGEDVRRFYDLKLTRYRNAIFAYSWTAIHPIDSSSPLYGETAASLAAAGADIIISLTGIDETFSQTVYARYAYPLQNIVWGARFADITGRTPEGEYVIDYASFDEVVVAATPPPEMRLVAE